MPGKKTTRHPAKVEATKAPLYNDISPKHYQVEVQDVNGRPFRCEVADLIEALVPNDAHLSHVYTYLMRVGRKTSSTYVKDVLKAAWWCIRAAVFHGAPPAEVRSLLEQIERAK